VEKSVALSQSRLQRFINALKGGYAKLTSYLTVTLRLSMGWIFLYSGVEKLYTELTTGNMATYGYLRFAVRGPFAGFFSGMAGNPIVNGLVVWAFILIGIALILGIFVRWSSFWGIVMMFLFYFSAFPPEHNPFIDDHIIYILVLAMFMVLGAGRIFGLDKYIERTNIVRKRPWLKAFLG